MLIANAWILASRVEAIKMYLYLGDSKYDYQYYDIIELYANHINEIAALQDTESGQWHQVINETSTFFEASASTGFFSAILEGKIRGILPLNVYDETEWTEKINWGWNGLKGFVDENTGIIYNACCGTGPEDTVQEYNDRSTAYCLIGNPGDAAFIINGIISYQQYLNLKNNL